MNRSRLAVQAFFAILQRDLVVTGREFIPRRCAIRSLTARKVCGTPWSPRRMSSSVLFLLWCGIRVHNNIPQGLRYVAELVRLHELLPVPDRVRLVIVRGRLDDPRWPAAI